MLVIQSPLNNVVENHVVERGMTVYFVVLVRGTGCPSKDFSRSFEEFQAGGNIQDFLGIILMR